MTSSQGGRSAGGESSLKSGAERCRWHPGMSSDEHETPGTNRRCARPSGRATDDAGYTLIEMLMAIVLMGTIILSIMGGMWAVVRASSQNDARAKVQADSRLRPATRVVNYSHMQLPRDQQRLRSVRPEGREAVGWPAQHRPDHRTTSTGTPARARGRTRTSITGTACNQSAGLTPSQDLQKLTIPDLARRPVRDTATIDIVKADIRPEEIRDVSDTAEPERRSRSRAAPIVTPASPCPSC